jgi:hypothetical protein
MKRLSVEVANLSVFALAAADTAAQPKAPPDHCKAFEPVQLERPKPLIEVPKRLVVEAFPET